MENGGNMFPGNHGQACYSNINLTWDIRELNRTASKRFEWGGNNNINAFNLYATSSSSGSTAATWAEIVSSPSSTLPELNTAPSFMFLPHHVDTSLAQHLNQEHSIYTGNGSRMHPDPHLVCLNLGKRHYFEDSASLTERHLISGGGLSVKKKGKAYYHIDGGGSGGANDGVEPDSSSIAVMGTPATVPRCLVEGCDVELLNAKEYHRRHKVCEMHSKAPKVIVLGLEQRFCQQCSRFHVVSEFDDSKRSCRRRLAGHNERRRKTAHDSSSRNSAQENKLMTGRFPYHLSSSKGRALSLLSSTADSWISPSDLSARSSAALRELIAENRAAVLSRQLVLDRDWHLNHGIEHLGDAHPRSDVQQHPLFPQGWDEFQETGAELTLNLMQATSSASGMLSVRAKSQDEEECSELWNSLEGTHVV